MAFVRRRPWQATDTTPGRDSAMAGVFPGIFKLQKDSNQPRILRKTRSDPSNRMSDGNEVLTSARRRAAGSVISSPEVHLVDNKMDRRLTAVLSSNSSQSDNAILSHNDPFKQIPDKEDPPRVASPTSPPLPPPPPASIPPPPSSLRREISISYLEAPHVSLNMESPSAGNPAVKYQPRSEAHGPPQRLELSLGDRRVYERGSSLDMEWERVQKLRIDNWSLRSRIHEMRNLLREKQLIKSTADDRLLQHVSMFAFGISSHGKHAIGSEGILEKLMKDCRDARGEYGPLEDDCNRLEDQLSEQEYELTRLEKHFYDQWKSSPSTSHEGRFHPAIHRPSLTASTIPNIYEVNQDHPLVTKLLSRTGDLDLLQERFVDLEEEKESLEVERDSRQRFGMSLAPDDQAWLDGADTLLDELLEKIRVTDEEIGRLRQKCFSLGLVDENGEPTDFQSQERSTFSQDGVNSENQVSEYVKHPILLRKPGTKSVPSINLGTDSDKESASLGWRINQWILDQLRESALEVNLLERTFKGEYGEIGDGWDASVLAVWNDDETADTVGNHHYTSSASSMTTQAPFSPDQLSTLFKDYPHNIYDNRSYSLILTQHSRPSYDHSAGTDRGSFVGKTTGLGKAKVHWKSE